jgi:hypothetical protein
LIIKQGFFVIFLQSKGKNIVYIFHLCVENR